MTLQDDISRYLREWHQRPVNDGKSKADVVAAGLERDKIIIDRADLPKVEVHRDHVSAGATSLYSGNPSLLRKEAFDLFALADHFEARESEEARVGHRRDELAQRHYGVPYEFSINSVQSLVDYIVELESQVSSWVIERPTKGEGDDRPHTHH